MGIFPLRCSSRVAAGLNVPLEEIYGVSTFYSQFTLNPKGQYKVSVCLGTACYVKGSGDIYNALKEKLGIDGGECTADGKFSLDACRCIAACGLAPVITINDEVYGRADRRRSGRDPGPVQVTPDRTLRNRRGRWKNSRCTFWILWRIRYLPAQHWWRSALSTDSGRNRG